VVGVVGAFVVTPAAAAAVEAGGEVCGVDDDDGDDENNLAWFDTRTTVPMFRTFAFQQHNKVEEKAGDDDTMIEDDDDEDDDPGKVRNVRNWRSCKSRSERVVVVIVRGDNINVERWDKTRHGRVRDGRPDASALDMILYWNFNISHCHQKTDDDDYGNRYSCL